MSHSAPFFTSLSLVASKSPESTRRSRILQTDGIYPDSQTFRRSFQAQHGSYDKKELEMQICRNFEEIISRSDSKNSGDFKTNLKKLDPHNLMFLADYYYRKLISEKNCRSKTFDCEVIKSFFIDDPTNLLISSFYNRLERLFKHDFTNPAKTNIKSKFLKTDIDSDQNNFFKKLISLISRHEQELNSSLVRSSHIDNLSKSLSPSLATSFNLLKETVDSSRLSHHRVFPRLHYLTIYFKLR